MACRTAFIIAISAVVYVVMMIVLVFVLRRGRGDLGEAPENSARLEPERSRKMERSVKVGVAITAAWVAATWRGIHHLRLGRTPPRSTIPTDRPAT